MCDDFSTTGGSEVELSLNVPGARPAPPPLRIHHLMACAAVAAVQFSLWRVLYPQSASQLSVTNAARMVAGGGLSAIGVTLAIFSVYWHLKGLAGLVQPGQWLLVGFAFSALNSVVMLVWLTSIGFTTANGYSSWRIVWSLMFFATTYLIPFIFHAWCAWKVADTWSWRIVFIAMAISPLLTSGFLMQVIASVAFMNMQSAIWTTYIGRGLILLLVEGWAAARDLQSRRKRYWTHWAGVALSLLVQLSSVAGGVAYLLYGP